jgi:putative spermidine/putrescine transport system ATP-binding protein
MLHAPGLPRTGAINVFVRPHRIRLLTEGETAENEVSGILAALDYTGDVAQLVAETPAGRIPVDLATSDGGWRGLRLGDAVRLGWRATDTIWFAAA